MISKLCIPAVAVAALLLAGCSKPLLPYSLDTYPLVLTPSSLAKIEDGRDRFREIYCAIQRDHGAGLPYDRPCEDVILRLEGELEPRGDPVWLGPSKLKLQVLIVSGLFSDCVK